MWSQHAVILVEYPILFYNKIELLKIYTHSLVGLVKDILTVTIRV